MHVGLGIVQKGNVFLLIQKHDLSWMFPGGKQEPTDENIKQTIIREVLEETGITCKPHLYLGKRNIATTTLHYYVCTYNSGTITIQSEEIKDCIWCTAQQIQQLTTTNLFEPVQEYLYNQPT